MNLQELRLSLFASHTAYSSVPKPLEEIVRLIQYDSIIAERTRQFREMMATMGKKTANRQIKSQLVPAFGVAVQFKGLGHSAREASGWTGLAMCDIDGIDDPVELEATFGRLAEDPHVLLMYRTISGHGLHIIYLYERENGQRIDDTSWRAAFLLGNESLSNTAGHAFDSNCSDYTRLCGLASDPRLLYRPDAVPYLIPDDLVVEQNCEYQEHGKPRKVYESNTFRVEPEEAWPRVEQMLAAKQMVYGPGRRHDYILHASYLFNRFGVPLDALLAWANQEWADHDKEERERAIRHQYKDTGKYGCWKLNGKKKGRENAMVTLPELRQWLDSHILVRYNLVTDQLVWREKSATATSGLDEEIPLTSCDWKPVDETEVNTWRYQIALDTGKRVLKPDVESIIRSDFAKKIHPVRQFIERLPDWDGTDYVAQLASHVHVAAPDDGHSEAEAQEYLLWTLRKWLVGMVATWMDDRVQNQTIFAVIGPQGIYKTTFFRHLLPPPLHTYFIENAHNSFSGKDDHLALSENCLVEIEEVDAIEGRDLAELKSLVSSETVKERRPYAKFRETKARLASFCASGNEQHILTDVTGSRRWLCHLVSGIDNPREWNLHYEQFYSQLRHEYRNGFQYYFNDEEEIRVERHNERFKIDSFEEQLISTRFRKPRGNETCKLMNASMIALLIFGGHIPSSGVIRKIGIIMRQMKFRFIHKRTGDFYRVVEIPFDQQQNYIAMDDEIESDDKDSLQTSDNEELALPF